MTLTNVALYEALKPSIGEEAARMIAEVVPPTRDLATQADITDLAASTKAVIADVAASTKAEIAALDAKITELRGEMNTRFAEAQGRQHADTTRTIKWLIGVFVPVWLATWGSMLGLVAAR